MNLRYTTIFTVSAIFFFGALAGWFFTRPEQEKNQPEACLSEQLSRQLKHEQYAYLSRRIFVENQNDVLINFLPLREALHEYVDKQNSKVGVYFEYLPSGISVGVNDKKEVEVASLSKVPIVMSIFKKIERGEISLSDIIMIEEKNLDRKFGTLWKKGAGINLSVEELVRLALIESDNTAYNALFDRLTIPEINEVYENLDIVMNQEEGREGEKETYAIVSPKNYSSIFRSLYLSSFLLEEHSNFILKLLTQTAFNDKIPAGVGKNIPVAHKIGIFTRTDASRDVFTDCGIIYVPNRPYILCTFVLDTDKKAQEHIALISKMIYGFIIKVQK